MADRTLGKILITDDRLSKLADVLLAPAHTPTDMQPISGDAAESPGVESAFTADAMNHPGKSAAHLTDEEFVRRSRNELDRSRRAKLEAHLASCAECAREAARLSEMSRMWGDKAIMVELQRRARRALGLAPAPTPVAMQGWRQIFAVGLETMLRPAGAYGESQAAQTSTIEFPVVQDGAVINGLRGLLVRTERDLYVQVAARDAQSNRDFGDRKALISISDSTCEQPILQRKIDIGVTVLLGTDVKLSRESQLAVEMLPEWES